jgi:hypothetical protein
MTNDELDRLAELERKATAGPFEFRRYGVWTKRDDIRKETRVLPDDGSITQDRELFADLRNSAPALIALAREALAARKAVDEDSDGRDGHPHHSHLKPATWDDTNVPCDGCLAWMEYQKIRTANEASEKP